MDQIKLLLATTGLSADDLIKKLSEYKALEEKQETEIVGQSEKNVTEEESKPLSQTNEDEKKLDLQDIDGNLIEEESISLSLSIENEENFESQGIEENLTLSTENLTTHKDNVDVFDAQKNENNLKETIEIEGKKCIQETQDLSQGSSIVYNNENMEQECLEVSENISLNENDTFLNKDLMQESGNSDVINNKNVTQKMEVFVDDVKKEEYLKVNDTLVISEDTIKNSELSQPETVGAIIIEDKIVLVEEKNCKSNCPIEENIHIDENPHYLEESSKEDSENLLQIESEEDKVVIQEIDVNETDDDLIHNDYIIEECVDSDEDNIKLSVTAKSSEEELIKVVEITHDENSLHSKNNDDSFNVNEYSKDSIICIEDPDGNVFVNSSVRDSNNSSKGISENPNDKEKLEFNVSEICPPIDNSKVFQLPSEILQDDNSNDIEKEISKDQLKNCREADVCILKKIIVKNDSEECGTYLEKSVNQKSITLCEEILCENNGFINKIKNSSNHENLEEEDAIIIEEIEVECNEKCEDLSSVSLDKNPSNTEKNNDIDNIKEKSSCTLPSTSRLKITNLIEERLNSEKNNIKSESKLISSSKDIIELSSKSNHVSTEVKRQPILGYIRKSQNTDGCRKRIRTSKPPWLMELSDEDSNNSITSEVKVDNMRDEIFNQLKQLRQKKEPEPLVDIVNPIPRLYIKRTSKKVDKTENNDSTLGLKIVDVKGRCHDIENIKINSKTLNKSDCKIINENLESNIITLTKTKDYTKIKGWQNKKLLIEKAKIIPHIVTTVKLPGCSIKEMLNCDEGPSCSYSLPKNIAEQTIENNVFASNNLDGFLDEQKDLNISYNVPNLTSSSNVDFLDSTVIPNPQKECAQETKRRFRLAETEDANCINQNVRSDPYKPRTLAEKRKLLELAEKPASKKIRQEKSEEVKTLSLEESIPANVIYSSIYYRGRRFKVPSTTFKSTYVDSKLKKRAKKQYKYVEVKKYSKKKIEQVVETTCEKRKPSIYLKNLQCRPNLTYKPGPLCKKISLQNGTSSKWKSVIKKLPKVYLEIYPHYGKKIHPRAQEVINFDSFEISEERLEFALTAISTEPPKNPIKILVPYKHNQQSILLQQPLLEKREVPGLINIKDFKQEESSILDSVQDILNDMITCIENKEVENIIIKDDPDVIQKEETMDPDFKPKVRMSRAEIIKGTSKKTSLELKRLNVKFIEVNIDDSEHKPAFCSKPYCHLGCVCKSLSSVPIPPDHCGEAKCIFHCHCGFDKKKTDSLKFVVPPGTDILSDRTVSRLQDEAKKNLAKVEKEFTQTVIHAYNQTIVVGDKTNRKRRATKIPKKYEDYLESQILLENNKCDDMEDEEKLVITPVESPMPPSSPVPQQNKECLIRLSNLDLKHLMPYCLEHNLYNCHCDCKADYTKQPCLDKSLEVQPKKIITRKPKPLLADLKRSSRETKKPARYEKALFERDNCARTKGAPTRYYTVRNRTATFRKKLARKLKIENDNVSIDLKLWLDKGDNADNDVTSSEITPLINKPEIKLELKTELTYDPLLEPIGISSLGANKPSRRKQHLQIREETTNTNSKDNHSVIEPALQRRKKNTRKMEDLLNGSVIPIEINGSVIKNITASEMVTPNPSLSKKFSEMLSDSGSSNQFRLIQWSTMIKLYHQKLIQIWFAPFQNKMKFIITDSDKKSVTGYQNVRQFEEYKNKNKLKIDLIRWIVTRSSPSDSGEDLLVILKIRPTFLEICGICSKNQNKNMKIESIVHNTIVEEEKITIKNEPKVFDSNLIVNRSFEITPVESQLIKVIPSQVNVTPIMNEEKKDKMDIQGSAKVPNEFKTVQQVIFSKGDFIQKKLVPIETSGENVLTIHCHDPESLDAALPNVPNCKWRMLKVNSNFSILSFKRNQFRIKCSDIITVMKVSQRIVKTIIINTEDISLNYPHKLYGIYIVPNYSDRIFIGPYFCYENHDLETLRFVNNVLINTEVFNKMQKTGPQNTTGVWYQQFMKKRKKIEKSASFIDLTETEDLTKKTESVLKKSASNSPRSILKTSFLNANLSSSATLEPIIDKQPASESKNHKNIDLFIENLFYSKLTNAMKQLNLILPDNAIPISFKVNFDNGLIHGYTYKDTGHIYIYWPGDSSTSCKIFKNINIALEWLHLEIKSVFILVPNTFEIKVELMDKNDYTSVMSKCTISNQYFKDVHIVGNFGILKLTELAEYLAKNPQVSLGENDKLKLKTGTNEFKTAILKFLNCDSNHHIEFLNKIKVQLYLEQVKFQKLSETKKTLELKKYELLKKHTTLLKHADPMLKEKLNEEFMKKWVNPKSSSKLEKIKCEDIICLDSDDDDTNNMAKIKMADKNTNTRKIKAKIIKSNCKLKITPLEVNRIESIKSEEEPREVKRRRTSAESVTLSSKKIKMLDDLFVESKTNSQVNCTDVEKIDLSHISVNKVRSLLGANIRGNRLTLTQAQLNSLKALSHRNKFKTASVSQDCSLGEESKTECS